MALRVLSSGHWLRGTSNVFGGFRALTNLGLISHRATVHSHLATVLNTKRLYSEEKKDDEKKKGFFNPVSKELQLELSRGYLWDVRELESDPNAKFFEATKLKKPVNFFPETEANSILKSVIGVSTTFAKLFAGENRRPALVICTQQRHVSAKMVNSWVGPFNEKFGENGRVVEIITLSKFAERLFSFVYRIIAMKMSFPANQSDIYIYKTKNDALLTHLRTKNRFVAYVFLVDKNGEIRWKAVGKAEEEELNTLFSTYEQLLLE